MSYCNNLTGNDLIMHAKTCQQCTNQIVIDNTPLIHKVQASFAHRRFYDQQEFVQEGRIALADAVARFDDSFGTKYSTLAFHYIFNSFRNLLDRKTRKEIKYIYQDTDDWATYITPAPDLNQSFELEEKHSQAAEFLDALNDRLADVIRRRLGISPYPEPQTLEHIASEYNLSKERIRQLETEAYTKMRRIIPLQPA